MASSNRHWPSMFKSKPCNTHHHHHHQWQHDVNSSGFEEKSPEPKTRWNPRPEQIRILEGIFNSGIVNPPRDEIRKIRGQLQEYGQVGDANVFYWFQNRKSRTKHKQRLLQNTPPSSSSSSSSKSSTNSVDKNKSLSKNMMDFSNSASASVNNVFSPPRFFFPVHQTTPQEPSTISFTQEICFPDIINVSQVTPCPSLFLNELQESNHGDGGALQKVNDEKMKPQQHLSYTSPPTNIHHLQDVGEAKSTVFINDVAFEVAIGENFNVRNAFGNNTVLIHSSGQPVVTNEWGVTLHPLQSGAFYYLFRTSASTTTTTPSHGNTCVDSI